jgi:hypothetical protein
MITVEEMAPRERIEEELMAWLFAKSPQEFRQFLASPWVASLFSPEAIEQLYQQLQQQEASPLAGTEEYRGEEYLLEVGMD